MGKYIPYMDPMGIEQLQQKGTEETNMIYS